MALSIDKAASAQRGHELPRVNADEQLRPQVTCCEGLGGVGWITVLSLLASSTLGGLSSFLRRFRPLTDGTTGQQLPEAGGIMVYWDSHKHCSCLQVPSAN